MTLISRIKRISDATIRVIRAIRVPKKKHDISVFGRTRISRISRIKVSVSSVFFVDKKNR